MAYIISIEHPQSVDAIRLMTELSQVLKEITGDSGSSSFQVDDLLHNRARFVIARNEVGIAVGCGAFRQMTDTVAEVKRMYASIGAEGVGSAVLGFLEHEARLLNYAELLLETRLVNQRAISFYQSRGYRRIPNFGRYVGRTDAICFAKQL